MYSMPCLSTPITQDECLYDGLWAKQADNLFVDLLIKSHVVEQWRNGRPGVGCYGSPVCAAVFNRTSSPLRLRFGTMCSSLTPYSVAYQHSGDSRWEDLRFMFEEMYSLKLFMTATLQEKLFLLSLLYELMWFQTIPITMFCKRCVVATTFALPNKVGRMMPRSKAPSTCMPMS
ncbi:leucyl/phenylalanyl-tRNA--protein transferase [Striga asiatica]|uniref:Leucyl/phenylalanyl-tRNA--protein transferase n=1 Tax=Striga asiatica TaxID=4170 RepID=A0A5A7Q6J3_STRAF|nr:leucyl/phenylalanyl-tRNA--protein transferase [Striga asiatica]